jgi:hypothetical protein
MAEEPLNAVHETVMLVGFIADEGQVGAAGAFGTVSVSKVITFEEGPAPTAL